MAEYNDLTTQTLRCKKCAKVAGKVHIEGKRFRCVCDNCGAYTLYSEIESGCIAHFTKGKVYGSITKYVIPKLNLYEEN